MEYSARSPRILPPASLSGRILLAQKKIDDAIAVLRKLFARRAIPGKRITSSPPHTGRTRCQERPRSSCSRLCGSRPNNVRVHQSLAELCLETGEIGLARESAARAVQLQPADAVSRLLLGTVLLRERKLADAREHLATAVQLAPANPRMHLSLGLVDATEGKYADAERAFETALKANSRFTPGSCGAGGDVGSAEPAAKGRSPG